MHISALLWIVCFYEAAIVLLLPSSTTLLWAGDGSASRMIVDLAAMAMGLFCLGESPKRPAVNIWVFAFLFFMLFSHFHAPSVSIDSPFVPQDTAIYDYKPMFEALLFFIMYWGVSAYPFTCAELYVVSRTLGLIGVVYSVYVLMQRLGMDQIYKLVDIDISHLSRNPQAGGFIMQPVYAASLITLCLPFVMRAMPAWILVVLLGIGGTGNRSAWVALAILGLYFVKPVRRHLFGAVCAYGAILAVIQTLYAWHPGFLWHQDLESSGRLAQWKMMIADALHPAFAGVHKTYALTGLGIGSFSVFYPFYHQSSWAQAHNEYIECFYGLSWVGLFLLLKITQTTLRKACDADVAVYLSLTAAAVIAFTLPIFHHPQLAFLIVFLAGMANNPSVNLLRVKKEN